MMHFRPSSLRRAVALAFAAALPALAAAAPSQFTFGAAKPAPGFTAVSAEMAYSSERGFGFEPGSAPNADKPFYFTVDVPEGNYNVTVTFGDDKAPASTTVKAELRRLMLENVKTKAGESVKRTFTVNTRNPVIPAVGNIAAGRVKLKTPRESVQEAWAWDGKLTLEFNGAHPSVRAIEITPVNTPTLFLIGDSTVCDQSGEPYNSWGQMLPRFLKAGVAVSNHGESGETYRDSLARRRLDKILSMMKPGDTMLMQFGHNDQKQIKDGKGGPQTTYKAEMRQHVEGVRSRGGIPVIVSPMERRGFDDKGKVIPSLIEYADAAREVAKEMNVAFIDLNAMSKPFYEALGPKKSELAFAEPTPGHIDNTHHNSYGSYELAKAVINGLRENKLAVAAFVADDFGSFDPAHPDPVEKFAVPASPHFTNERPLGDEANK
ncbi:MAG: GDSL-type esterase/lipase family protein [Massilia sp.]